MTNTDAGATLQELKEVHRRLKDLQQARIKIENQMKAVHRRLVCRCPRDDEGRHKHDAECRAYVQARFDEEHGAAKQAERSERAQAEVLARRAAGKEVSDALLRRASGMPSDLKAMAHAHRVLESAEEGLKAELGRVAATLPTWEAWAKDVRGMGPVSFGQVVGELGRSPREYRSVAACWKRLGLAVVGGMAQGWVAKPANRSGRGRACGDDAVEHGYSPRRRSVMYVVGTNIEKQGRGGPYRAAYDDKKAEYLARGWTPGHARNAALRFATKMLVRDLYVNWVDEASVEEAA